MPYPNEHAQRINNPDKYIRLRRKNDEFGAGIDVIYGVLGDGGTEVQAIRFDKTKFTEAEAKKWLKEHDYKIGGFEPASGSASFTEPDGVVFGDSVTFKEGRDAIIQSLGSALPGYKMPDGKPLSFDPDLYEQALQDPDIPLIFANNHPDSMTWKSNPVQAVEAVNGRFVGNALDGQVIRKGKIRAQAKLDYRDDPEVEALYQAGHLGVSPAVEYFTDSNGNISRLKIQNILLFPEDVNNRPGDKGTVVFKEANMAENDKVEALLKEQMAAKEKELDRVSGEFSTFMESTESQITTFKEELSKRDETIKKYEAVVAKFQEDAREAKFATFLEGVPDGMKHTDEQKAELKKEFEESPQDLLMKVVSFKENRLPETRETGNSNFESFQANGQADIDALYMELRESGRLA